MHNRSKYICIILKDGINDPGLAFAGKVGLGPFWTWVQVLSYVHVWQLLVGTFVSSFRHERTFLLPARAYVYWRKDLHEDASE
jgi:hypothetical protein